MVDRFGLEPAVRDMIRKLGVEHAWQAYPFGYSQLVVQLYVEIYDRMLADPDLLGDSLTTDRSTPVDVFR